MIGSFSLYLAVILITPTVTLAKKIVIAHRGAPGYLPEHTLEGKAVAIAMGADYIEQDLVLTKDRRVVVLHDIHLEQMTDVLNKYPGRKRNDGHFYVIDFTLEELLRLAVSERFVVSKSESESEKPVYAERFPIRKGNFKIHTLEDELELVQGMEKTMGRKIGIYPEIKAAWFHRKEGYCIRCLVMPILEKYGYFTERVDQMFLQLFDPTELMKIRNETKNKFPSLKLIQLMSETSWGITLVEKKDKQGQISWILYNYDWMFEGGAMKRIAEYANGIGPWYPMLVNTTNSGKRYSDNGLAEKARKHGLLIHPYTFRYDKGEIPAYAKNFDDYLDIFFFKIGVDGVFTDFPDKVVNFLQVQHQVNSASMDNFFIGFSFLLFLYLFRHFYLIK